MMGVTVKNAKKVKERHGIIDDLLPLKVRIGDVREDPNNARQHSDESIEQVAASLKRYGQRKPIVVNQETGIVEAGNGTLKAALSLKWSHIAVVRVKDDHQTAAGYAIADNRVAELSDWDTVAMKALLDSLDDPAEVPGVDEDWLRLLAMTDGDDLEAAQPVFDESAVEGMKLNQCPKCEHRWPA